MIPFRHSLMFLATLGLLTACDNSADSPNQTADPASPAAEAEPIGFASPDESTAEVGTDAEEAAAEQAAAGQPTADPGTDVLPFNITEVTEFDAPWAMTFLPDGRLLVTEMAGSLRLHDVDNDNTGTISGVPEVEHVAQGGLGDVVLHPEFASNQLVYISFVEADDDGLGAAVARARLVLDDEGDGSLEDLEVIWRQSPKKSGDGHFGYRIAFDEDGLLWISSSERKEFDPAQDMNTNLGKIVRLNDDGSTPNDNPFVDQGEIAAQIWTLGHR